MSESPLFAPYTLNSTVKLKNRIVMAPLTRCFADDNLCATEEMANYYERRADAGLIISEATIISPQGQGYPNTPGIYTQRQIESWKKVTEKVHQKGGIIFLQLWHVGRVSHPFYLKGEQPVSASAIALEGRIPRTKDLEYGTPRELSSTEVEQTIQDYIQGAINARQAGFDGVEIHGANGYLVDQFFHAHTNHRQDEYGGTVEKRASFALSICRGIGEAIGFERTGIRLSPASYFNMTHTDGDEKTFIYFLQELEKSSPMAYIHTGIFDDTQSYPYLNGRVSEFLRRHSSLNLIACGNYHRQSAIEAIEQKKCDLVAFGKSFIANADCVSKLKENKPLNVYTDSMLKELY